MNTIEEFFLKNRLSFNVEKAYICFRGVCLYDEFKYSTTIHNPQSLNIKTTFDLIEKLKPLLYSISSNTEKFIKEDKEYYPGECSFKITASVDFSISDYINSRYGEFRVREIGLFECDYGNNGLRGDMNIFQRIKSLIEEEIEENPYNLLFNTNSFVFEASHRNIWPYTEYVLETIDCKRTGSFRRLESFRAERRALLNSSGHNFRGLGILERLLGGSNQEGRGLGGEIEEESRVLPRIDQIDQEGGGSGGEIEEEIEEEEGKINKEKTFKEDECVICLTNPPNVLFCNCGHIAICVECDKVKSLKDCPMCKTETTIKRTLYIEY